MGDFRGGRTFWGRGGGEEASERIRSYVVFIGAYLIDLGLNRSRPDIPACRSEERTRSWRKSPSVKGRGPQRRPIRWAGERQWFGEAERKVWIFSFEAIMGGRLLVVGTFKCTAEMYDLS